ncbi:hypothetical protein IPN41_01795 [Candidatus Falkowbacteria bacterium]|nr:MAG: hypothetical protein IPN41_01795 [Candidatus Falkowbacteria bacterium]
MQYMDILKETFSRIEKRMDERFDRVEEQFAELRDEIKYLNTRVGRIEKYMVHKSQFNSLLIILEKKEVISSFDKSHVLFKNTDRLD